MFFFFFRQVGYVSFWRVWGVKGLSAWLDISKYFNEMDVVFKYEMQTLHCKLCVLNLWLNHPSWLRTTLRNIQILGSSTGSGQCQLFLNVPSSHLLHKPKPPFQVVFKNGESCKMSRWFRKLESNCREWSKLSSKCSLLILVEHVWTVSQISERS